MAKNSTPIKHNNKKHVAHLEKEKQQSRLLITGFIVVILLVVGLLGYGLLNEYVLKDLRPVAQVGDDTITPKEFETQVRFDRYQLMQQYSYYLQIYQVFQSDPTFSEQFRTQLTQIQTQLSQANAQSLGESTINKMVDNLVIKQEAQKMGISVSESEIDEAMQTAFNFYPNGTPTPEPSATPYSTSTLSPTQLALVTVTPTPTEIVTEAPTEAPTATAAPAEASTEPTEEATPNPTATPYTLEGYQKAYADYLTAMQEYNFTEAEIRSQFETSLLNEKVTSAVTADVQPEEEQVWARHILVADKAAADIIRQALENGEDWTELAAKSSTDTTTKDNGGDLGWFGKGQMVQAFEDAAFSLNVGEISEPVQTDFGWHIIQVLGKEVRPLTSQQLDAKKNLVYQDWLSNAKSNLEIEIKDTWKDFVPVEPNISADMLIQ